MELIRWSYGLLRLTLIKHSNVVYTHTLRDIQDVVNNCQQAVSQAGNNHQILPLLPRKFGFQRQAGHSDNPVHGRADLVTHIGKELGLGPVSKLSGLARLRVLLNRITKRVDHLVYLSLETVHLTRSLNGDKTGEVAIRCGGGNLGEGSNLRGEGASHDVDYKRNRSLESSEVFPELTIQQWSSKSAKANYHCLLNRPKFLRHPLPLQ
ncbi:hypothetical protein BC936DRAFT_146081 [Jimgerdemannia flammicorona]|uniref:Uncharacterized protein n=2 Tax=Jimgerdemannia flammicorona TaxID=994334 RepID=A0A433QCA5_9FUNG|nr:hypothetical protein BC936DRAFT_146081 [Jimgerdemannia flammicorona]RUS27403.1 hypothetical protein BC938DRAFT_483306 [Jimgerdemannia flammicorona]